MLTNEKREEESMSESQVSKPKRAVNVVCELCGISAQIVHFERDPVLLRDRAVVECHGKQAIVEINPFDVGQYGFQPAFGGRVLR
jgi:hypothetical protein